MSMVYERMIIDNLFTVQSHKHLLFIQSSSVRLAAAVFTFALPMMRL